MAKGGKNIKKLLIVLLAVLMAFTLVAGGKNNGNTDDDGEDQPTFDTSAVDLSTLKLSDTKNLVVPESREINTLDYVTTALQEDTQFNVNFVDGLVETDRFGNYVGAIAESW